MAKDYWGSYWDAENYIPAATFPKGCPECKHTWFHASGCSYYHRLEEEEEPMKEEKPIVTDSRGFIQTDKVTVEVSLTRHFPRSTSDKSVFEKSINFICSVEEAERVFRAACEAATREKNNGGDG